MIRGFQDEGFCCVDLETACLYALARKWGLMAAAIHIVSDSPCARRIDLERVHEASFPEQVAAALTALHSL